MGIKEKKRAKAAKLENRPRQSIQKKERTAVAKADLLNDIEEKEPLEMRPLDFHSEILLYAKNLSLW